MKNLALVGAMALGLAACGGGGGDRAVLLKACVDDGTDAKACECMADAAKTELIPKMYQVLVKAAKAGPDGAEDALSKLEPAEQGEFMGFAMKAAMTCGMS